MGVITPDYRIYGMISYRLMQEGERLTRAPDRILNCTVFLGVKMAGDDEPKIGATAFILSEPFDLSYNMVHMYLVTATHNLIDAKKFSDDGLLYIRSNRKDSTSSWMSSEFSKWYAHPDTDLSILPLFADKTEESIRSEKPLSDDPKEFDINHIPVVMIASPEVIEKEGIGVGDEVMAVGLFSEHPGTNQNIPLVRSGIIASMLHEPIYLDGFDGYSEAYLIEMRSIGGFSGSPVFVYLGGSPNFLTVGQSSKFRLYERLTEFRPGTFYLLGLIHGHWDIQEDHETYTKKEKAKKGIGTGIAPVIPASKIFDLLQTEEMKTMREEHEKKHLKKNAPIPDTGFKDGLTKKEFEKTLKKVSEPTPPDEGTKGT